VDARAGGKEVIATLGGDEMSPNEAADILGMSRPQVRKLMDDGAIQYRMVGTHHRISVDALRLYLEGERKRRRAVHKKYVALQNDLGLYE
jgi:excisionase family DNA binding protein